MLHIADIYSDVFAAALKDLPHLDCGSRSKHLSSSKQKKKRGFFRILVHVLSLHKIIISTKRDE